MHYTIQDPRRVPVMAPIQIPKQHNGWFMWILLILAGLVVAGVVYSFWRIASVPKPTLDVPGEGALPLTPPAQEAPSAR